MGNTLRVEERRTREARVRQMLDQCMSLSRIAVELGVTRQAVWEFCGRRGWLPGEDQAQFSKILAQKDQRRREKRAASR